MPHLEILGKKARLRVVHNIPSNLVVNVYVDDVLVAENVAYMDYSDYLDLKPGKHMIKVQTVDAPEVVLTLKVCLKPCRDYTVVALGSLEQAEEFPLRLKLFKDDNTKVKCGRGKVRLIHGAAGVPAVDAALDDCLLFGCVRYPRESCPPYRKVRFGTYQLKVAVAGTTAPVIGPVPFNVVACKAYTLLASGIPESSEFPLTVLVIPADLVSKCC